MVVKSSVELSSVYTIDKLLDKTGEVTSIQICM